MSLTIAIVIAVGLDYWLGEPKRLHPLVGFGALVDGLESWLNPHHKDGPEPAKTNNIIKAQGFLALLLAIGPIGFIAYSLEQTLANSEFWLTLVGGVLLYLAIGWRSLIEHAKAISQPLYANDLVSARKAVSMIVSRDTGQLNEQEIATAATESVLENGADAIFAAIFWFIVAGIPGVVIYRLSNTLDAMWGYKNPRFLNFGFAAARFDDLLNFIPARLTALSYTLCGSLNGHGQAAWQSWRQQAGTWKSPNAGPVMSSGAGAIGVTLGGSANYHGQTQDRPVLGKGELPMAKSIDDACTLVDRSLILWVLVIGLISLLGAAL